MWDECCDLAISILDLMGSYEKPEEAMQHLIFAMMKYSEIDGPDGFEWMNRDFMKRALLDAVAIQEVIYEKRHEMSFVN